MIPPTKIPHKELLLFKFTPLTTTNTTTPNTYTTSPSSLLQFYLSIIHLNIASPLPSLKISNSYRVK